MPISQELMTALLSMDSYNRGYGEGILGLGGAGSQIGTATMLNYALPSGSEAAGFYAATYTWNGKTIISYRGTDTPLDYLTGWTSGAGFDAWPTQVNFALEYYENTLNRTYEDGAASNVILTGHSLGGGLMLGKVANDNHARIPLRSAA